MWGWAACRRTDRCQSELQSLSCVATVNNLSSTLQELGAVFVCLALHVLILSNVSAQALLSALFDTGSQPTGRRSWLTVTYGKCISTSPYSALPSLPPTGLAYLLFPVTRLKDNMFGSAFDDRLWTTDWLSYAYQDILSFSQKLFNKGCDHYLASKSYYNQIMDKKDVW